MPSPNASLSLSSLAMLAVTMLAGAAPALAAGTIKGSVKLDGKAPEPAKLNMRADPFCAQQAGGVDEEIAVGTGGALKNVVVRITKGVTNPPPAPSTPAVVDQNGCMYKPRVVVARAGQTVEIRNSDQTLHNVHTYKGSATLFNLAHIQGTGPQKKKFPTAGDVVKFKCDVHPWMTGWVRRHRQPLLRRFGRRRQLHHQGRARRQVHRRGVAREAGHPDQGSDRDRRRRR